MMEKQMENIYLLSLEHKEEKCGFIKSTDRLILPFATKEKSEEWLIRNGFVFGWCNEFNNNGCKAYWFHQKDTVENHVIVRIESFDTDDEDEGNLPDWVQKLTYR